MGRPRLPPEIRDEIYSETNQHGRRSDRALLQQQPPSVNSPRELSWAEATRKRVWESGPSLLEVPSFTIFSVPANIRQFDPRAYEPTVVTIGPITNYWFGDVPARFRAMEDHKWVFIRRLLSRHKNRHRADNLLDKCLAMMKASESEARRCYSEHVLMEPHTFARIMLLDGCFILYLLLKQVEAKVGDVEVVVVKDGTDDEDEGLEVEEEREVPLPCSSWIWNLVKYDLLKLENQIPFFIVQQLFDVLRTPDDAGVDLVPLALRLFSSVHPHRLLPAPKMNPDRVHHLLHLYHLSLLPPSYGTTTSLLAVGSGDSPTSPPEWIPSATELQEAGVKFRRKTDAGSMLEVTFDDGVMEIPPLHVYSYSNTVFRNLMGFELCFPVLPYITSYVLFMDCIMHTARDVRLLHLRGIVMNGQSDDEEVAKFFGRLRSHVQYAQHMNYLWELYIKVGRYHESRWHKWQAVLKRDYFGNPWVVVSVVAAAVLLLLTVEQAFFAALAYFRPPPK